MAQPRSGCTDQVDDGAPDTDGAKADGLGSKEAYRALFSPGVLRSIRTKTIIEGRQSAGIIGFQRGIGCHIDRDDAWKTNDLVIEKDATFAVDASFMGFLRYSSGQLGFSIRLRQFPEDLKHVPLVMFCWGDAMPTPEETRDALLAGASELRMEFTPSGVPQPGT